LPVDRIRVLFFDHTATMSGGEIALLHLLETIDRSAVDPVVVLGADGPLAERLRPHTEVHILALDTRVSQTRKDALGARSFVRLGLAWSMVRYIWKLAGFMRRNAIELVHTNSLKSDVLGGLAAKLAGRRVVWHLRDRIAPDYLPARVVAVFRRLCGLLPDAILANSHATAATILGTRKPVYVVHDGVPAHLFAPRSDRATGCSDAYVGIVGRISPWKGQDIFLRAAQIVRRKHPSVRFRIIGAALFEEAAFEAELRALARELDLEDAVEFRGFCRDVPGEVAALRVCVHASTRPEPFGQVIIEAMAAGIPVVATNAGGVPEIVEHGVTGMLVPMGDAESMAAAIGTLLAEAPLAARIALDGRRHVEAHFSIEATAARVEEALLKVARRTAGPSAVRTQQQNGLTRLW
jgi:glycosyltransferase involved in cell wall biosynthesis